MYMFTEIGKQMMCLVIMNNYQAAGHHLLKPFWLGLIIKINTAHKVIPYRRKYTNKNGHYARFALYYYNVHNPWGTATIVL